MMRGASLIKREDSLLIPLPRSGNRDGQALELRYFKGPKQRSPH